MHDHLLSVEEVHTPNDFGMFFDESSATILRSLSILLQGQWWDIACENPLVDEWVGGRSTQEVDSTVLGFNSVVEAEEVLIDVLVALGLELFNDLVLVEHWVLVGFINVSQLDLSLDRVQSPEGVLKNVVNFFNGFAVGVLFLIAKSKFK